MEALNTENQEPSNRIESQNNRNLNTIQPNTKEKTRTEEEEKKECRDYKNEGCLKRKLYYHLS